MRRRGLLIAAAVALSGCKYLDRKGSADRPPDPAPPGDIASRVKGKTKDQPSGGEWLPGAPGKPAARTDRNDLPPPPPGGLRPAAADGGPVSLADGSGLLAGYVEAPDGRKLADVFVAVARADQPPGGGAPKGAQTLKDGSFVLRDLQPGAAYTLTVKTTVDGREAAALAYVRPPNPHVRLILRDGLSLSDTPSAVGPGADRPSGGSIPPPPPTEKPDPVPLSQDQPPGSGVSGGDYSPVGPPPSGRTPPTPPPGPRSDLTTTIPNPNAAPAVPSVLPGGGQKLAPGKTQSKSAGKPEFVLVDAANRARSFPTGRADELLLVEFLTTTCLPCQKAAPVLRDLQARYAAKGLEVIGVVCDEVDTPQRRAFASKYQLEHRLNYLLYVEPGKRPGAVMDRYEVEAFPTLLLLAGDGRVLWRGDSRQLAELEAAVRQHLPR